MVFHWAPLQISRLRGKARIRMSKWKFYNLIQMFMFQPLEITNNKLDLTTTTAYIFFMLCIFMAILAKCPSVT